MVRTTRGRGGGTVVSYRPATPAHGGSPGSRSGGGAAGLARLPPGRRAGRLLRGRDPHVVRRRTAAAHHGPGRGRPGRGLGGTPAGGLPAPPGDRIVTASPMTIEAVTEVQACLHDMLQAIPVLEVNIEHSSRQHRAIVSGDPRGRPDQGPAGDGAALRRHGRAAARPPRLTTRKDANAPQRPAPDGSTTSRAAIDSGEIDTVVVAFTDMQGRLQGKRLHGQYFLDVVVEHGTEGCNYLLGVDIDMNTVAGYAITSWDRGYGDMEFVLDLDTIRLLTHLPATAMVQCDLVWPDQSPVLQSPRSILKRQMDRAAELGFDAFAGTELEFIVFEDTYEEAHDARLPAPDPGQPVQRRLLDRRHHPGRAAAARHPQHHVRRRAERRGRQGRVQLRPARDRLPVRRRAGHRRQPRGLQDGGQGDRGAARPVADLHGQVQRARGQLLPHPPVAARQGRRASSSGTTRPGRARRSTTSSSPASWRRCRT